MGLRKDLMVVPGTRVRLADIDPGSTGGYRSEEEAKAILDRTVARLADLQQQLYAEKKHGLLIILQGIDAAGKDGTCWHVMRAMNPQGTTVTSFQQPTDKERQHDFLWRVHPHAPGRGQVAVFNRSHYEDVLAARVHGLVPEEVWAKRYDQINAFEELLIASGVTILKFFLTISPDEQLRRFKQRLDDPARRWKISASDYTDRALWNTFIAAFEDMLERCSTPGAPWFVVPSNVKWFRNLAVSHVIRKTMKDMRMSTPDATVDLDAVRQAYERAVRESR